MVDVPERIFAYRWGLDGSNSGWNAFKPAGVHTCTAAEYVRADLYAALEAKLAEKVKVKTLEWTRGWMNAEAQTEIGQYTITYRRDGSFEWGIGILKGWASSWDGAKAAAQTDYERRILSALEATPPAPKVTEVHPDDLAVDRFAIAMKAKLTEKRAEGRRGWDDPAECSAGYLSMLLVEHIEKGDPLDVGNLAMMLHERGDRIADERERYAAKRATLTAAQEAGKP